MSNKKYTEMTDTEIKQHLDDTAKWLSKKGYDGDAIMRPELQHINEQNAEIERLEAKIADLRAQLAAANNRAAAAVKDLKALATHYDSCLCCKDYTAGLIAKSTCCSGWEWRGNHGTEELKRIAAPACGIGVSPQDMGGDHGTEGKI